MCNFLLRCVLFPLALCTLSAPGPVAAASSPPAAADPATSPTPPAPLALPEALRLRGQAEAVMATGRFTEGLALAQEALARAELLLPPGHKELPDFLIAVGYAHANRAEHASARTYYLRARTAVVQAGGPESPGVAFCETLLGLLAKEEGDLVTAAGHNDRAIAIYEARADARPTDLASAINNQGLVYLNQGDLARAEALVKRALAIREVAQGPQHPDLSPGLVTLGEIYRAAGDPDRAQPLVQRALALREAALGPKHPRVAQALNNLALLHWEHGRFNDAEPLYRRALAINEEAFGPRHPEVAFVLHNLGRLAWDRGDPAAALPLFQRALAIREQVLKPKHPELARALNSLGMVHRDLGDLNQAEVLLQRALALRREILGPWHRDVISTLSQLALLREAQGHSDAALTTLREALIAAERLLRATFSEARVAARLDRDREVEDLIYTLAAAHPEDAATRNLALTAALLRKGRSADEGARAARALLLGHPSADERARFDRLRGLRARLASLYLSTTSPPDARATMQRLEDEADALEYQLSQGSAALAGLRLPAPEEIIAAVAARLPADGALVELLAYRADALRPRSAQRDALAYLALVLLPDATVALAPLGPAAAVDEAAAALLRATSAPGGPDPRPAARRLFHFTLAPLLPRLGGRSRLLLAPESRLSQVPFAALHDGRGYLIDRYHFSYLTSGRDLLRSARAAERAGPPLVLADPDFAAAPAGPSARARAEDTRALRAGLARLAPLPFTRREAAAVGRHLPGARLLLGADASEANLLGATAPVVLHIATHGLFLADLDVQRLRGGRALALVAAPVAPALPSSALSRSALALAGALRSAGGGPDGAAHGKGERDGDGLATALEVTGMDLWGTQLVVLSACDTGRGDVRRGQGVYGLRRAFFTAGAETVVTSLWKVADRETEDLMDRYYRKLRTGLGRAAGLEAAALEVRSRRPHPYFWAPFIAIGQDAPLVLSPKRPPAPAN